MTRKSKKRILIIAIAIPLFLLCGVAYLLWPSTPEARFRSQFKDLSVGIPSYQTFRSYDQPPDAIKGDFFSLEIDQSESQFRQFAMKLGVSPDSITSSNETWIRANSKLNPKYPWDLKIKAAVTNSSNKIYRVHVEGRQTYD